MSAVTAKHRRNTSKSEECNNVSNKSLLRMDFSLAPYSEAAHQTFTLLPVSADIVLDGAKLQAFCDKHYKIMKSCLLYLDMTAVTDNEQAKKLNRFFYSLSLFNGKYPFRGFAIGVEDIPVWSFSPAHQECEYVLAYLKSNLVPKRGGNLQLSYDNRFIRDYRTQNVCCHYRRLQGCQHCHRLYCLQDYGRCNLCV